MDVDNFLLKYLTFNYVWICVGMCTWGLVSGDMGGTKSLGVIGGGKLPNVGAEDWAQVFCKSPTFL